MTLAYDASQPALIQQLRGVNADSAETRPTTGVVSMVGATTIDVQLGTSSTIMHGVSVSGGVNSVLEGDTVYLLWLGPQPLAVSTRSSAAGTPGGTLPAHTHNDLYYLKSYLDSQIQSRAAVNHNHDPLNVRTGLIGGWTIDQGGIYETYSRLSSHGFIGFGNPAPNHFGDLTAAGGATHQVGVYLGWDYGYYNGLEDTVPAYGKDAENVASIGGPALSLYRDGSNYLQWSQRSGGARLLIKAANFTLDGSGNITAASVDLTGKITATTGDIAGWHITGTAIVKDTGVAATSAGLEPVDYPFYSGAVYANRATAPFRVTNAGGLYATGATISGTLTATAGSIGGWSIGAGFISSANIVLDNTGDQIRVGLGLRLDGATQQIWVGSATPRLILDGGASQHNLRTDTFVSGVAGFKLDGLTGSAEFNNVSARGEFHASVFVTDEQHAIAGSQIALPSAALYSAVTTQ